MNVKGAMKLWRQMVEERVKGHSNVRWWSKGEIWMLCAKHRDKLPKFIQECLHFGYGEASTMTLKAMILEQPPQTGATPLCA